MSVKSSVSMSEQQDAFVRALVEEGRFASASAVVQQGLELLRAQTEREEAELAALRAFFEDRANAPVEDSASARAATEDLIARKRTRHGL
ncbi:MAG: type II toxin-antitoxin system ParD family antitoxin [Pseudomonadota bacterium]